MSVEYNIEDSYLIPADGITFDHIIEIINQFADEYGPLTVKRLITNNGTDKEHLSIHFDDSDQPSSTPTIFEEFIKNYIMPLCADTSYITTLFVGDWNSYHTFIRHEGRTVAVQPITVHIGAPEWFIRRELSDYEDWYDCDAIARELSEREVDARESAEQEALITQEVRE